MFHGSATGILDRLCLFPRWNSDHVAGFPLNETIAAMLSKAQLWKGGHCTIIRLANAFPADLMNLGIKKIRQTGGHVAVDTGDMLLEFVSWDFVLGPKGLYFILDLVDLWQSPRQRAYVGRQSGATGTDKVFHLARRRIYRHVADLGG